MLYWWLKDLIAEVIPHFSLDTLNPLYINPTYFMNLQVTFLAPEGNWICNSLIK